MLDIEKLHELLNTKEEDLFRLLFPQVAMEMGEENRFQLIEVVLHAVDVLTWNFAAEFTEFNIFGNQGFNSKGDSQNPDYLIDRTCYGRGGREFSVQIVEVIQVNKRQVKKAPRFELLIKAVSLYFDSSFHGHMLPFNCPINNYYENNIYELVF